MAVRMSSGTIRFVSQDGLAYLEMKPARSWPAKFDPEYGAIVDRFHFAGITWTDEFLIQITQGQPQVAVIRRHQFYLRYPSLAVATILPFAAFWIIKKVRKRSQLNGEYCLLCGYDLRATRNRCPECGTVSN